MQLTSLFKLILLSLTLIISAPSHANDAYDPFIDYSEYDDNGDEEADVNFFKNGKQFTLHFVGGYRGLTGELGAKVYDPAISYGLGLNFFMDLRLAIQFHYILSNHNYEFNDTLNNEYEGSSNFHDLGLSIKYYINTQNVIRNLAKLNPYLLLGFSYVNRVTKASTSNADTSSKLFDSTAGYGANLGGGFEIQMSNKKFYIGGEAIYQLVTFEDEGTEITPLNNPTGIHPNGDLWRVSALVGINF